jgi:hypothetical protein
MVTAPSNEYYILKRVSTTSSNPATSYRTNYYAIWDKEVEDQYTGRVFARKVFRIGGSSAERKRIFENEIRVVQRLAPHHHITRIFATYVGRREVGLLLTPVANRGSLDAFLQDAHEGLLTPAELDILNNSFGCLTSGLEFMHAQKV